MDHAAHPENHLSIQKHFGDCNKVFIECFYLDEDKSLAEANYHSYAAMSGKVMAAANVAHPIPAHFSRKYKADQVEDLVKAFHKAFEDAQRDKDKR